MEAWWMIRRLTAQSESEPAKAARRRVGTNWVLDTAGLLMEAGFEVFTEA
jgi:hypothetical protein